MTAEITNLEEFKDKFSHLLDAHTSLGASGAPVTKELSSKMIDEFLYQFTMTTPAPAPRLSAGWVVTVLPSRVIPYDFQGKIYESKADAQLEVTKFIGRMGYGRTGDYEIAEVTYLG